MDTALSFDVRLDTTFDDALEQVGEALREHGFGLLTRIDVKSTLKEKLDVEFRDYAILGACNPGLAHRALSARPDVGLLLPCNVTVEAEADGGVTVRIADPGLMMSVGGVGEDPAVAAVANEARELLRGVAASLTGASQSPETSDHE